MACINRSSFTLIDTDASDNQKGTVEVTIGNKTKRVEAIIWAFNGSLVAYGLLGRYEQGSKAWDATLTLYADGGESARFGRDDRSGRFNKQNCIYFA